MICGGMFLSYGVFNIFIGNQQWIIGMTTFKVFFISGCFHIALIVGAVVTSFVYKVFDIFKIHVSFHSCQKKLNSNFDLFQLVNSSLMLAASVILIVLPNSYAGVVTSRSIFGLGFGSSYISFIIYASEISSPKVRAHMIFTLHLCLTFGMFLFSIFCLSTNFTAVIRVTGSITVAFNCVATALGYFKLKASHIFMMQNNSKDALERFQYFQQDSTENPHVESETMLSYIIEEKKRRYDFFGGHNLSALAVILLVKFGYLAIFNALHNFHRTVFLSAFLTASDTNYSQMIMMGMRLCGCTVGFFLLDRISKRLQYFIPAIIISTLLFIFGSLLVIYQSLSIWTPMMFFIPLEFFMGVGLSPIADILKGELFPLKEKPVSIAATIVLVEAIHMLCIILLYSWISYLGSVPRTLTFIFGAITSACGISVFVLLKDSRKQSLRTVSNLYS
jgi:hypothetical protein